MIYLTIEFWELVLDVVGLSICGITILYLIRNRSKYNQSLLKEPGKGNFNNFNEEVFAQLVKQQSDGSFETISSAIEKERMLLDNKNSPDRGDSAGDRYGEVSRLADLGLSIKEISERAKIPRGEVELVVKLKELENKASGGFFRLLIGKKGDD